MKTNYITRIAKLNDDVEFTLNTRFEVDGIINGDTVSDNARLLGMVIMTATENAYRVLSLTDCCEIVATRTGKKRHAVEVACHRAIAESGVGMKLSTYFRNVTEFLFTNCGYDTPIDDEYKAEMSTRIKYGKNYRSKYHVTEPSEMRFIANIFNIEPKNMRGEAR